MSWLAQNQAPANVTSGYFFATVGRRRGAIAYSSRRSIPTPPESDESFALGVGLGPEVRTVTGRSVVVVVSRLKVAILCSLAFFGPKPPSTIILALPALAFHFSCFPLSFFVLLCTAAWGSGRGLCFVSSTLRSSLFFPGSLSIAIPASPNPRGVREGAVRLCASPD